MGHDLMPTSRLSGSAVAGSQSGCTEAAQPVSNHNEAQALNSFITRIEAPFYFT